MKRHCILAALAAAFLFSTASVATAQGVLLGVKGGLVAADVSLDGNALDLGETSSNAGLSIGAWARINLGPTFSVQPEILWQEKGFEADNASATFDINYFQVPVLLQFHIQTPGPITPRIFVGPALAFESDCSISDGSEEMACEAADVDTKSTDVSAVFGAGVDLSVGTVVVTVDGRYDLGLSNLDDSGADGSAKSRAFEAYVGLGFPVGL